MRIAYIANHGSGGNDDEGAIVHALAMLWHEVTVPLPPSKGNEDDWLWVNEEQLAAVDFILFHKGFPPEMISKIGRPAVLWDFDLVENPLPRIKLEVAARKQWYESIKPLLLVGFCTDGGWVAKDQSGKLRWLMQGMDERVAGFGEPGPDRAPILYVGNAVNCQSRKEHLKHLLNSWGNRIRVIGDNGIFYDDQRRVYGRELADIYASTIVTIALDGPQTDRYWSNRIYNTLGLGGFLIHPYCAKLADHYGPDELVTYRGWNHLDTLIRAYINDSVSRERFRQKGMERTLTTNLYRHRCQELIKVVEGLL